jgi:hypothetical protein
VDIEAIREGMTVYSEDNKKLGRIIRRDGDDLIIEKGLLSKNEYVASLDDVMRVEEDRVWLRQSAAEIEGAPEEGEEAARGAPGERARDEDRLSAAPDEEEVVMIEEEVVMDLPTDEDEPGAMKSPGRNPNGRR